MAAAPVTVARRSRNRVACPRWDSRSSSGWAMTHQMRMGLAGLVMTVSMLSTRVRFFSSRCLAARARGGRWAECDSGCGGWCGAGAGAGRHPEPATADRLGDAMTVPGRCCQTVRTVRCSFLKLLGRGLGGAWLWRLSSPAGHSMRPGASCSSQGIRRRRGHNPSHADVPGRAGRTERLRQAAYVHSSWAARVAHLWVAASEWFAPATGRWPPHLLSSEDVAEGRLQRRQELGLHPSMRRRSRSGAHGGEVDEGRSVWLRMRTGAQVLDGVHGLHLQVLAVGLAKRTSYLTSTSPPGRLLAVGHAHVGRGRSGPG